MGFKDKISLHLVDKGLRFFFKKLGHQIGETPLYFVIVPLLLTALASTGFQRISFEANPEYLFSPLNGEGKVERQILEEYFPTNFSDFDPGRASRHGRFGRLVIKPQDNTTILRQDVYDEIVQLDELVRGLTVKYEERLWRYRDLCATWQDQCWQNDILLLAPYAGEIENGSISLTYPLWFDPDTFTRITFPFFAGGIVLSDEDHTIQRIEAINLNYFLKSGGKEDVIRGALWEAAFLDAVGNKNFTYLNVARFSSLTLEIELENNTNSVMPYFALNIGIMIAFCVITCMMSDWVRSKPLLGLLGVISAILACATAFGFVIYCGMSFIGINMAVPFLMLGIGIDDTFVMLGAWRRTSIRDSVPARMGECFQDAAVSITITSLTDMLSFWVGVITPFPCVKIFCTYTGAAVAFTYLWHITFFGACMALAGYAEKENRHSLTCLRVQPKSQSGNKSLVYRIFCPGGINKHDPFNPKDNKDNWVMSFFRDRVARALNNRYCKVLVLILFSIYLVVAFCGMTQVKEGLQRERLARFDSYAVKFYAWEDQYFRKLPYRINVVISGVHNYSDPVIQKDMDDLLKKFEASKFVEPTYTESWLRDYVDYLERSKQYEDIDTSTEEKFLDVLFNTYLSSGITHYVNDIAVKDDPKRVVATRFLIQSKDLKDAVDEKDFVEEIRDICKASKYNVTVFHPYFIYFDQFLMVLPTTIQCVIVAALCMMAVSLIFIPNPICSLWVAFSIISIEMGVVGFMSLWDVYLDSISMINLIMCIGFSVDFSAHISYHFMSRSDMTPSERVEDSLFALGLPITQGAISTILGVLGLVLAPSYVFLTFFKMVFLVIVLGALHGLLLLPVLLSLFGPGASCSRGVKQSKDLEGAVEENAIKLPHEKDSSRQVHDKKAMPHNNNSSKHRTVHSNGAVVYQNGGYIKDSAK